MSKTFNQLSCWGEPAIETHLGVRQRGGLDDECGVDLAESRRSESGRPEHDRMLGDELVRRRTGSEGLRSGGLFANEVPDDLH